MKGRNIPNKFLDTETNAILTVLRSSVVFMILPLIFYLLSFIACVDNATIDIQEIEKQVGPDEVIHNLTMISTIGGKTDWQMVSAYVERYNSERRWVAYDAFMETLNAQDKNFYRADSTYINEVEDTITGMGNVEIISPNGILHTQHIIWYRQRDQIHAPGDVYLKRNQHEMWGANLFTNSNFDYVDMKSVRGRGTVDNDELGMWNAE